MLVFTFSAGSQCGMNGISVQDVLDCLGLILSATLLFILCVYFSLLLNVPAFDTVPSGGDAGCRGHS